MRAVLEELALAPLPSRLADPVHIRTTPNADGSLHLRVAPPVGERLPFVASVGVSLGSGGDGDEDIELKATQQPFALTLPPSPHLHKTSLNLVLYLQKHCTVPTWPLRVEVATREAAGRTEIVEFYSKPWAAAPRTERVRSRDTLVEAHDDPDRIFKKKRKAADE